MMRPMLTLLLVLLALVPGRVYAAPETLMVDAPAGVTACELEQSLDNGTTWKALTPQATPSAAVVSPPTPSLCTFTVTPSTGRSLYRWAYFFGTTRVLRTDGGIYLCLGLPDCPLSPSPSNVGLK